MKKKAVRAVVIASVCATRAMALLATCTSCHILIVMRHFGESVV